MRTLFLLVLIACAGTSNPQDTPAQLGAMQQIAFAQAPQPLADYSASGARPLQDLASVATTICPPGLAPANYGMVPQYFASSFPPFLFYAQAPTGQTAYANPALTQEPADGTTPSISASTTLQQVPWLYPVNAFAAQWQSAATKNPAVESGSGASTNTWRPDAGRPQSFFIHPPFYCYPVQWPASFAAPQSSSNSDSLLQTTAVGNTFVPQAKESQQPHTNTTTQPCTFSQMPQSKSMSYGPNNSTQPMGFGNASQHQETLVKKSERTIDGKIKAGSSIPTLNDKDSSVEWMSTKLQSNVQKATAHTTIPTNQSNRLRCKFLKNSITSYIHEYYSQELDKPCRANINSVVIRCNANFKHFFTQAMKVVPVIKLIYFLARKNTDVKLRKQFSQLGVNQKLIVAMKLVPHQAFGLMRLLGFDDVPEVFLFDKSSAMPSPFVEADLHNFSVLLAVAKKNYPWFFNYAVANVPELVHFELINSMVESDVDNLSKTPGIIVSISNVLAWYKRFDVVDFAKLAKVYLVRCPNISQIVYESHTKYGTTLIYSILGAIQFDSKFLSALPQESYFIEAVIQTYYAYYEKTYSFDATFNVLHYISEANPMYTVADVLRNTAARLPHELIMSFVEKMTPLESPSILFDYELIKTIGATRLLAAILALYRNVNVSENGFVEALLAQEKPATIDDDKSQSSNLQQSIVKVPFTFITDDNASLLRVAMMTTKFHRANLDDALDMVGQYHGNEAKARVEALLKEEFM